jgi:hypothetical protein
MFDVFRSQIWRRAVVAAAVALAVTAAPAAFGQTQPARAPSASAVKSLLPVGPEGARTLTREFGSALADWLRVQGMKGRLAWKDGKEPRAVAAGDHYEIRIPPSTLSTDKRAIAIDSAFFEVRPQPDGTLAVSGTPPKTVSVSAIVRKIAPDGTTRKSTRKLFDLDLGQQSLSGTFVREYGDFTKFDYTSAGYRVSGAPWQLRTGEIRYVVDLTPDTDRLLSGFYRTTVADVVGKDAAGETVLSLAALSATGKVARLDVPRMKALAVYVNRLDMGSRRPPLGEVWSRLVKGLAGFDGSVRVDGLKVRDADLGGNVEIGGIEGSLGFGDLDRPVGNARLGLSVTDVTMPSPLGILAHTRLVPSHAEFALSASGLPNDVVRRLLDAPRSAHAKAGILADLKRSGTEVKLDTLGIVAGDAAVSGGGGLRFAAGAAFDVIGAATLSLRGVETVIAELRSVDAVARVLTIAQALGQAGKDDRGREIRTYRFEATKDGQLLMNGADLMLVVGMARSSDQPSAPAKNGPKRKK